MTAILNVFFWRDPAGKSRISWHFWIQHNMLKYKQGDLDDAREITAVWCWNVKKTKFRGGHLGILAAILNWQWVLHKLVLYINHFTNFDTFITKWTIDTPIVIFYHFLTMQTGSSYLQIIPFINSQSILTKFGTHT